MFANRCNDSLLYVALTTNLNLSSLEAIYNGPDVSCANTAFLPFIDLMEVSISSKNPCIYPYLEPV